MASPYDSTRVALYSPERRETLFVRGTEYSPLQLAVEGARLAYIRAEKSEAERARLGDALARAGFDLDALFSDSRTGTEAFAAHRAGDDTTLLAFRGTQPDEGADLATDIQANMVEWPESAGRVHGGFAAAARSVLPEIARWCDEKSGHNRLILTGHSLGAALATLAATVFHPALLVTLGSPRPGDADFAATLAATDTVRLVNCCDIVTELPPPVGGYVHVKPATYFDRNGERVEDPSAAFVSADRQQARLDYTRTYAWKIGSVLVRDLADHAPINYGRLVFP